MMFEVSTFDEKFSKPGQFATYLPPRTYFSCNEQGMLVTLDLARLIIPEWWLPAMKLDLARQGYKLDRVGKIMFGTSTATPRNVDAYIEISELTLRGRTLAEQTAATGMAFVAVACLYLVLTAAVTGGMRVLEKRFRFAE